MGKEMFDDPFEAAMRRGLSDEEKAKIKQVTDLLDAGKTVPIELEPIEEIVLAVRGSDVHLVLKNLGNKSGVGNDGENNT